jgi:hypothetical protein
VLNAAVFARDSEGNKSAAKMAMMAMTTSNSMSVKARWRDRGQPDEPEPGDTTTLSFWREDRKNGADGFNGRIQSLGTLIALPWDHFILTIPRKKSNPLTLRASSDLLSDSWQANRWT